MEFLKTIGGKIAAGLVAVAVIAAAISWWQMDLQTRRELVSGTGKIFAWGAVVLVVPWAGFLLIRRVAKFESNAIGAALVIGLTLIEAITLAWLFGWAVRGALPWTFFAAAALVAGVYNLFTCDWIAEE